MYRGGDNRFSFPVSLHNPALFRKAVCWGQLLQHISVLLVMICFLLYKMQSWKLPSANCFAFVNGSTSGVHKYSGAFFTVRACSCSHRRNFCGECIAEKQDAGIFQAEHWETERCLLPARWEPGLLRCTDLSFDCYLPSSQGHGACWKNSACSQGWCRWVHGLINSSCHGSCRLWGFCYLGLVKWPGFEKAVVCTSMGLAAGHRVSASGIHAWANPTVLLGFREWHSCSPRCTSGAKMCYR